MYFRTLDILNNASELQSNEIKQIEEKIRTFENISSFTTQFILFATWYKVNPVQSAFDINKTSTFQVVLISDGQDTFIMYIYEHDEMQWTSGDSNPDIFVGYLVQANRLSNVYSFTPSVMQMDKNTATKDITGLYLRRLTATDSRPSSKARECLKWYNKNAFRKTEVNKNATLLPQCPCNLISFGYDPWFPSLAPAKSGGSDINCSTAWPSLTTFPYAKTCCYNISLGLWTDEQPKAGGFQFYHPLINLKENYVDDVAAKENCCDLNSNLCRLYYELHPVGTCYPETWFRFGTFWGDPHFRTLDNFNFTFNGLGEYILMNLTGADVEFELQARTEKAQTDNNTFSDATVFSAFAVTENGSSIFHVELNENKTGIILYGNKIDLTSKFAESDGSNDNSSILDLSTSPNLVIVKRNNTMSALFTSTGILLNVSIGVRMLTLTTAVPLKYQNQTKGLLGNFDGNAENDFIFPNGTSLPHNVTEREIHIYGMTWEINPTNSAFRYGKGKNHSNYQNNSHVPKFSGDESAALTEKAQNNCGKDQKECVFDFIHAGPDVAINTLTTNEQAEASMVVVDKRVSRLIGCNNLTIKQETPGECMISFDNGTVRQFVLLDNYDNVYLNESTGVIRVKLPKNVGSFENIRVIGINEDNRTSPPLTLTGLACTGCSGNGICGNEARRGGNVNGIQFAVCKCYPEYDGVNCEDNFDGCAAEPCSQGRKCKDLTPSEHKTKGLAFICEPCPSGFVDDGNKCTDFDECLGNNGGCAQTCLNTAGSFKCQCKDGYRIDSKESNKCKDVNECEESLHNCTQRCKNTDGGFQCACFEGYAFNESNLTCVKGASENNSCSTANLNCSETAGCTTNENHTAVCFCNNGYELYNYNNGTVKCKDIDECVLNVCSQNCSNTDGGFECSCYTGYKLIGKTSCAACEFPYYGRNCQSKCNCTGRGAKECHPVRGCVCYAGWEGENCDNDVNECQTRDKTCIDVFKYCENTLGSFACKCRQGYEPVGDNCKDVDECLNPVLNNCNASVQICSNTDGGYSCRCKAGYSLFNTTCIDINECALRTDECEQLCQNVPGQYNCYCESGYVLKADRKACRKVQDHCKELKNLTCSHYCNVIGNDAFCACRQGFKLASDNQTCTDINECQHIDDNACSKNATCKNTNGSYLCECPSGMKLQNDGRACSDCDQYHYGVNCSNTCTCLYGKCDRQIGCVCVSGWVGYRCDKDLNECDTVRDVCPSANTECLNTPGSYACRCVTGFDNATGTCQDKDECKDVGTNICDQKCVNTIGSYRCECEQGFIFVNGSCKDVDECNSGFVCEQVCENTVGGYRCSCNPGYQLDLQNRRTCTKTGICWNQTEIMICNEKNASCVIINGNHSCVCSNGFEFNKNGTTCTDIKECSREPKPCSQICTEQEGGFRCSCANGYYLLNDNLTCAVCKFGYYGENCMTKCECNSSNTVSCNVTNGNCSCSNGWQGLKCDRDIDECNTTTHICPEHARCVNRDGGYECRCNTGYLKTAGTAEDSCDVCGSGTYGENCEHKCNCSTENAESCHHINGTCNCKPGWTSDDCSQNINECSNNPCKDKLHSNCNDTLGSYKCNCEQGYTEINEVCIDQDECLEDYCLHNCTNTDGAYICSCFKGYQGHWNTCLECKDNHFGVNCTGLCDCIPANAIDKSRSCDRVNGLCKCNDMWTGGRCEVDVNECNNSLVCAHVPNSACQNIEYGYRCDCRRNYANVSGVCKPKPTVPTTIVNLETKKVISTTITLEINLPDGFNLDSDAGYEEIHNKTLQSLDAFYKEYIPGGFEIIIKNIRKGSVIVDYDIIYNKTDETIEDALVNAILEVASGTAKLTFNGNPISAFSGNGSTTDKCQIYESLISPCPTGFRCYSIEGKPACRAVPVTDNFVLTILIVVPSAFVFIVILFFIFCLRILCREKKRITMKLKSNREKTDVTGLPSNLTVQSPWPHDPRQGSNWKYLLENMFRTQGGNNSQPFRIPRPELGTYRPRVLNDDEFNPWDTS